MAVVADFLSDPKRPIETTLRAMITTAHLGPNGVRSVIASSPRELLSKSEKERSGVLPTAMSLLGLYRAPVVARVTRRRDWTTPLQWLLAPSVRRAQELLEIGGRTIGEVATASGFEAMVTFRNRFQQIVGVGPAAYRRRFAGDRGNRS